jgi:hypothetical protein
VRSHALETSDGINAKTMQYKESLMYVGLIAVKNTQRATTRTGVDNIAIGQATIVKKSKRVVM